MATRGGRAFTLVELLVVIAIIAIVAGLIMPVLAEGKSEARRTEVLSNLRQLAAAAALYEDAYGDFDLFAPKLAETGFVPSSLFASPFDPFEEGVANWNRTYIGEPPWRTPNAFKDSIELIVEQVGVDYIRAIRSSSGGGWTATTIGRYDHRYRHDGSGSSKWRQTRRGLFFRVTFDGAVLRRRPRIRGDGITFTLNQISMWTDDQELIDRAERNELPP